MDDPPSVVRMVNMHDAKTNLSRLVSEEFIIARDGRPVARVIPIVDPAGARRRGFLPDVFIPDDFDTMGSDETSNLFDGMGRD